MGSRFTRTVRQKIVKDFAKRHGHWDASAFLQEVEKAGEKHPAYSWFIWDDAKAAHEHRIEQARQFTSGLKIVFSIQEVGRKTMRLRETSAPLVISPLSGRRGGGGYHVFDPSKASHMEELSRQAAQALQAWYDRYEAALLHAGEPTGPIDRLIEVLGSIGQIRIAAE